MSDVQPTPGQPTSGQPTQGEPTQGTSRRPRPPSRCGFAAIVGAPNAGKSTLLNRMTGAKLSIVSPKAQTTRFRVLGILMREATQILLVDTPGIFAPKRRLDRAMVAAAWTGAKDADLVLVLVDAKRGLRDEVRAIVAQIAPRRAWLLLNKTDLIEPAALLPLVAAPQRDHPVRGNVHGQRRDRGRRRRAAGPARRRAAGRAASVSRRRPDRPAGPPARRRDRARADLPADPRGGPVRRDGRDGELAGAAGRVGADRRDHLCRAGQATRRS